MIAVLPIREACTAAAIPAEVPPKTQTSTSKVWAALPMNLAAYSQANINQQSVGTLQNRNSGKADARSQELANITIYILAKQDKSNSLFLLPVAAWRRAEKNHERGRPILGGLAALCGAEAGDSDHRSGLADRRVSGPDR